MRCAFDLQTSKRLGKSAHFYRCFNGSGQSCIRQLFPFRYHTQPTTVDDGQTTRRREHVLVDSLPSDSNSLLATDICLGDTARGWRGHLCCRAWIGPMEMANASCRPKTRGFEFDQLSRRHIPPTRCPIIEYHKQSTSHEPIAKSVSFSVSLRFRKCNRRKMPTMIPSKKLVRRPA